MPGYFSLLENRSTLSLTIKGNSFTVHKVATSSEHFLEAATELIPPAFVLTQYLIQIPLHCDVFNFMPRSLLAWRLLKVSSCDIHVQFAILIAVHCKKASQSLHCVNGQL